MRTLKQGIMRLAPLHSARDIAPSTWDDLARHRGAVLPVWSSQSDATIWDDAVINHAFRAFHDSTHIRIGADFSLTGETATIEAQIRALAVLYPSHPEWWARLLRVEGIDQVIEFQRVGSFPADQRAFVLERFGPIPQ